MKPTLVGQHGRLVQMEYTVTVDHASRWHGETPPDVRTHRVLVEVDLDKVCSELYRAAVLSKGGRARECHGAVRVVKLS